MMGRFTAGIKQSFTEVLDLSRPSCFLSSNTTSQMTTQQTGRIDPMLVLRWASVADGGFNPFNPHDALKHHFTSMKNDKFSKT